MSFHNEIRGIVNQDVESTIYLPPSENIQHALGANHDLRSGLAELFDNSIDAGATDIAVVFHLNGHSLNRMTIHDDGRGMTAERMAEILRLGGHKPQSEANIGRYGMGLKEGSYANADTVTVVSRANGQRTSGFRLRKGSFTAGKLGELPLTQLWNQRNQLISTRQGTSIIWDDLSNTYTGGQSDEGNAFLSQLVRNIRVHTGIRYHRFLESNRVKMVLYRSIDDTLPTPFARVAPINPLGYRKSGNRSYPKTLFMNGDPDSPGITAHIWPRSKTVEYQLSEVDSLGHQGFYFYDADRLITQGGWSGFRTSKKDQKLLRIVVDDPRVLNAYVTISPQKGSVRLNEDFHRFIASLKTADSQAATFNDILSDAAIAQREMNRKSGNPDPLSEAGSGLSPSIKEAIEQNANLKLKSPVSIKWGALPEDEFVSVNGREKTITLNQDYRKILNPGRGSQNDAPLVKSLIFMLFNDAATGKATAKAGANVEVWNAILLAALEEQRVYNERLNCS